MKILMEGKTKIFNSLEGDLFVVRENSLIRGRRIRTIKGIDEREEEE